ncbi:Polyketide cyclase / dehydrase and lipid transport [Nocardioides sp. YR527]|uniref:SRPBCC family protein n=1 Tax=Nocardioides sp. YR527 TaxID=1881028 RepID=UPI000882BB15|nr:SRPBCC family protein [Nocardioides sp. YR527]SDJ86525.1 Polyketide cyclase / dehydrase and lipid transport [Nocardioides sp. YR527]
MPARYAFAETWELPMPAEAVRDVLVDLECYPEWWPQVRAVAKLGEDDALLVCRSALPYELEIELHAVSRDLPTLEVELGGDLDGFARWTLTPTSRGSRMVFEQEVVVRGLLGQASMLLRPVLSWNHRQMMLGCRQGLSAAVAGA